MVYNASRISGNVNAAVSYACAQRDRNRTMETINPHGAGVEIDVGPGVGTVKKGDHELPAPPRGEAVLPGASPAHKTSVRRQSA